MAVVCTLVASGTDTISATVNTSLARPDDVVVFVVSAAALLSVAPITVDQAWLSAETSAEATLSAFAIFVGVLPDPVPPTIIFTCTGADSFTVTGKVLRGVDTTTPVADISTFSSVADAAALAISVGPVTAPSASGYLLYCVAAVPPTQAEFEAGPTPALPSVQLGRSSGLAPALESGIWAQQATLGVSSIYTQAITPSSGGVINGLAALIAIQPLCLV